MHELSSPPKNIAERAAEFFLSRKIVSPWLYVGFVVFATCSIFQSLWHGPWRDEAQAWLLARDLNLGGLILEARHDGHPILWQLCLKVIQALGVPYQGMEILNAAFICGAVWLLFFRSRLPLLTRLAFAFCPACLLEVSYYARNYAIAAFLIFLAATVYSKSTKRPILFASLLALVANTNLYGTAVFVGASFQFLLEQGYPPETKGFSLRPLYTRYLLPNAILVFAMLFVAIQVVPILGGFEPPRPEPLATVSQVSDPGSDTAPAWEKFLQHATHASVFKYHPHLWVYLLLLPALLLFRKRTGTSRIYGAGVMWLAALLPIAFYPASTRHLFMLTAGGIYFLWIYYDDLIPPHVPQSHVRPKNASLKLAGLVSLFVVALCLATQQSALKTAFTNQWDGRNAARAIIDQHLDTPDTLLVTTNPSLATSVLMPLTYVRKDFRPPPWPALPESFADSAYYRQRKHVPTVKELEPLILEVAARHPDKTILVISADPQDHSVSDSDPKLPLKLVYRSQFLSASPDEAEAFQVYVLNRHH